MSGPHVVVLGLGTAGAAVAAACAQRGLRVTGIDAHSLDDTGAGWVNGVPAWAFDAVGLARPQPPERLGGGTPFHLVAGWNGPRMRTTGVLEVDMRALTRRLLDLASAHRAELRGDTRVCGVDGHDVHLVGASEPLRAGVVVDATGLSGVGLLRQRGPRREDLCVAAQGVFDLADRAGADAFLERHHIGEGEIVCFTGIAGGYSIINMRVHGDTVSVLTGSIPALGHPSGVQLLRMVLQENPWIGPRRFGGSRAIPLARPLDVVGWGRAVAIGDAANMVWAPHGSGIAQQLLAADLLARTLADGGDPWTFNVDWQRTHGALLASADLLRRATTALDPSWLPSMIERGVLSPALAEDALLQRPTRPPPAAVARAARGLLRLPAVARALGPALARGPLLEAHHRRYPSRPSGLTSWRARRAWIVGHG